jgi:hypothetical protein
MNDGKHLTTLFFSLLLAALSCSVHAATVSFALDQSNALPDGVDYLVVTISDDVEGQLDFWVDAQSPLTDIAGENFGIQKFTFSIAGDMQSEWRHGPGHPGDEPPGLAVAAEHRAYGESELHRPEIGHERSGERHRGEGQFCRLDSMLTADAFILPEGWEVQLGKGGRDHEADGFSIRLLGTGSSRQDPLHFTVLGLTLEDVLAGFSAHVAGFEYITGECGEGEHAGEHGCGITSAWFYGERPVVVPVPAAAWLFGSGLLGMAGVARRRRRDA